MTMPPADLARRRVSTEPEWTAGIEPVDGCAGEASAQERETATGGRAPGRGARFVERAPLTVSPWRGHVSGEARERPEVSS